MAIPTISVTLEIRYNDRYFRMVLGAIAAHIIVMYNVDRGFFEALFTISYLRGFIGSWLIAMCMIEFVHYVTKKLDVKYDWHSETVVRLFWQLLLGFVVPAILAFLLAAFFFWLFDRNIFSTAYLQQDYPLIVYMIFSINIYYFGLNSFLRLKNSPGFLKEGPKVGSSAGNEDNEIKEVIVVDTLTRSIPLKVGDIAYCYILEGNIFIRTTDMASIRDSYHVPGNLRSLEELLDKRLFFRINRQLIVSFSACKYYKPGRNKTIELLLDPVPYPDISKTPEEHKRLTVVSEDRSAAFKLWMDR